MRSMAIVVAVLTVAGGAWTKELDVKPRFDVIFNPDLYPQGTPQETLNSILGAISRDRYDYIIAHLLDPVYVEARLASTQPYFERAAAEQIGSTAGGKLLRDAALQTRINEVATRLNVRNLAEQMRQKIIDEPDNLKELKRMARDGAFQSGGDTTVVTLKDVKDRSLSFKKAGGRWFVENRKEQVAGKE